MNRTDVIKLCMDVITDYVLVDIEDGVYLFQRGNYKDGFTVCALHEEDLTVKNMRFMFDNGYSRKYQGSNDLLKPCSQVTEGY